MRWAFFTLSMQCSLITACFRTVRLHFNAFFFASSFIFCYKVNKMKVAELKAVLKEHELDTKGLKADLTKRLLLFLNNQNKKVKSGASSSPEVKAMKQIQVIVWFCVSHTLSINVNILFYLIIL
jgi:hypothetical protein